MNNIIRKNLSEGINFTYIPQDKFKTTLISFSMITPLSKEDAPKNAILAGLLSHSCKKFPCLSDVSIKLEELYGASIHPSNSRLGESQVITITAKGLNSKFAYENSNNILDIAKLLCEMIFEPDLNGEMFKNENINQEKRELIESINSEMNDKKLYARKRCIEVMCENEKFGIDPQGSIETVKLLDSENVYKAWKRLLSSSIIEIMVIGSAAYETIISEFKRWFSNIERENIVCCDTEIIKKAETIKNFKESRDVTQCKLVMGLRAEIAEPNEDVYSMIVMNTLFGGSAQSKLFLNVREKLSLCYYCSSKYNKHKGIILIESGVESKNIEKAKEEIISQLKEIKIGNFTDEELEETKLYLSQAIQATKDSLTSLNDWYISQVFSEEKESPDEVIKKIDKVSREKVIEVANKITLDTVYLIHGKEEEQS